MPRRIHLEEPTKRSRQRRGRRKESLRAKGYFSDSRDASRRGGNVSERGNLPGRDDVSGQLHRAGHHRQDRDRLSGESHDDHRGRGVS